MVAETTRGEICQFSIQQDTDYIKFVYKITVLFMPFWYKCLIILLAVFKSDFITKTSDSDLD